MASDFGDEDRAYDDRVRRDPPRGDRDPNGGPNEDDRQMATIAHLGGIIAGFILPLVIWLIKKDQSRYVDDQGKEALNFQLTMFIAQLVAGVIAVATCGIGIVLNVALVVVTIVYACIATGAVGRGEWYKYPSWSIRMIK